MKYVIIKTESQVEAREEFYSNHPDAKFHMLILSDAKDESAARYSVGEKMKSNGTNNSVMVFCVKEKSFLIITELD